MKYSSLYSNINVDEKENEKIDEIIKYYTDDKEIINKNTSSLLIPLPISDKDLLRLKNQWNKEFEMKNKSYSQSSPSYSSPKKNIWKRLSESFTTSRSLYYVLTK